EGGNLTEANQRIVVVVLDHEHDVVAFGAPGLEVDDLLQQSGQVGRRLVLSTGALGGPLGYGPVGRRGDERPREYRIRVVLSGDGRGRRVGDRAHDEVGRFAVTCIHA